MSIYIYIYIDLQHVRTFRNTNLRNFWNCQLWADPPRGRFSPSLLRPTSHPTLHPTPCLLSSKKPGHPTSTWRHLQGVREYSKVPCTSVLGTFVLFLLPAVWLLLWYSYSIFVIFSYSFSWYIRIFIVVLSLPFRSPIVNFPDTVI